MKDGFRKVSRTYVYSQGFWEYYLDVPFGIPSKIDCFGWIEVFSVGCTSPVSSNIRFTDWVQTNQ